MMHPDLVTSLAELRARRNFDVRRVLDAKVALLNSYFAACGLTAAVVGVSGGVDSAVTTGLVRRAMDAPGSPIRRVIAACMPMFTDGATNQADATARGREVATWARAELRTIDLTAAHHAMRAAVGPLSPWASGQLVSTLRTPALYALTSNLTEEGENGVVVGTTNRDEGAYLGFFGKASDGMVDVQLISDLHKSEVYALGRALGVPSSVLAATPSGDVFDGRVDEQMIGAPYDAVELVLGLHRRPDPRWSPDALAQFSTWARAIEALHAHNAHKYAVGSPAVHLDALERAVPGGWSTTARPTAPTTGPFVGRFSLPAMDEMTWRRPEVRPIADLGDSGFVAAGVLDRAPDLAGIDWVPVGLDGRPRADAGAPIGSSDTGAPIGSWRATAVDQGLADALWERLRTVLPCVRTFGTDDPTDHGGHPTWRPVGLNPVLRFIRYAPGGTLVPHYDAGHDFGDGRHHTLTSVLISLDGRGATRFLIDGQRHLPLPWRAFDDPAAARIAHGTLERVALNAGEALVFDHRVLHDAEPWAGPGDRVVLRTDVIWQRCGPPYRAALPAPRPHHEVLGVPPNAPRAVVDAAWTRILSPTADLRLAWKVLRDPFVGPAYTAIGDDAAGPSGFFDDGSDALVDPCETPDWWVTPPPPPAPLDPDKWPCVLLCTGAYCPPHAGHVAMFHLARKAVEDAGGQVLAGYMSPGHDGYVLRKVPDGPNAAERIALCEDLVHDVPWLLVDPWEAQHTPVAVNYTDVVAHLEVVMARVVRSHRPVRVVYVAGGDNARFALSFVERGRCVIVGRPGTEAAVEAARKHPFVAGNERLLFVEGDRTEASRELRAARPKATATRRTLRLYVRDEGAWAVEPWAANPAVTEAWAAFRAGALTDLRRAYDEGGVDLDLVHLSLDDQRDAIAARPAPAPIVSLDACLPGHADLAVSRAFGLSSTRGPIGLTARPGARPVVEQLADLPHGDVVLLDDDVATGGTLDAVRRLLPAHTRPIASWVAAEVGDGELLDLRDLLPGAREAGLVVQLPSGSHGRAPYLAPYVRSPARMQLPWTRELAFSRAVWGHAEAFYAATGLRVGDTWPAFRDLLQEVGFEDAARMRDVCAWHRERLS